MTRARSGIDTNRLASAVSRPGIDPRAWLVFASVDMIVFDSKAGMYANCTIQPTGEDISVMVCAKYAGNKFGSWEPVAIDDIVVVGIPGGDRNNGGVLIGRMYRESDPPPDELSANTNVDGDTADATRNVVMVVEPKQKYIIRTSDDGGDIDVKVMGNGTVNIEAAGSGDMHVKQSGSGNVFISAAGKVYAGVTDATSGSQPPALGADTQSYLDNLAGVLAALVLPVSGGSAGPPAPGTIPVPGNLQAQKVEVK